MSVLLETGIRKVMPGRRTESLARAMIGSACGFETPMTVNVAARSRVRSIPNTVSSV